LTRIAIGPLKLGELPSGAHRLLSRDEVRQLQESAGVGTGKKKSKRPAGEKRGERDRPPKRDISPRPAREEFSKNRPSGDRRGNERSGDLPPLPAKPDSLGTIIGGEVARTKSPAPGKRAVKPARPGASGYSAAKGARPKPYGKKPAKKGLGKRGPEKSGGDNKRQNRFRGGRST
jgi:23S rRNA pseudouridine2605 synthase